MADRTSRLRTRMLAAICALGCLAGGSGVPVLANPTGPTVVNGTVTFDASNPAHLLITNSPNAIINWQSFGIAPGEITQFLQSGAGSAVLNRVTGMAPSEIMGQLLSNGQVFLINPNGIVFGPNSVVDTAGLVASTLALSNEDFLAGNLNFEEVTPAGEVSLHEQALIKANADGSVLLVAPRIENNGIIETEGGDVVLAAGRSVTLTSIDDPEIQFEVSAPTDEVVNLGDLLTRGGAARIFAGSIHQGGRIDADGVGMDAAGNIVLFASNDVTVDDGAMLSASGASAGEINVTSDAGTAWVTGTLAADASEDAGGRVEILGERVAVYDDAVVSADGRDGGGEVLIGGDFQGKNPDIKNARQTFVGEDAEISASTTGSDGDGGYVIVWADETTQFYGDIVGRAGTNSGDGGFAEVSGKQALDFNGWVDLKTFNGDLGELLLDPQNIIIQNAGGGLVPTPPTVAFGLSPGATLTITATDVVAQLGNAALTLQATDDITVNDAIIAPGSVGALNLQAGDDVFINADIQLSDPVNITAGDSATTPLAPDGTGDIEMLAGTTITSVNGLNLVTDAAGIGGKITVQNLVLSGGGGGVYLIDAAGDVEMQGATTLTDSGFDVDIVSAGTTGVLVNGSLTYDAQTTGGDVDIEASAGRVDIRSTIFGTNGDVDIEIDGANGIDGNGLSGAGGTGIVRTDGANADITLDSGAGIGTGGALQTDVGHLLALQTAGSGAAGNINVEDIGAGIFSQSGNFGGITTDAGSTQTVELRFANGLDVDGGGTAIGTAGQDSIFIDGGVGGILGAAPATAEIRGLTVDLRADGDIGGANTLQTDAANLRAVSNTGAISINNDAGVNVQGLTAVGDISLNQTGGTGAVSASGNVVSSAGNVFLFAQGGNNLDVGNAVVVSGASDVTLNTTGSIGIDGQVAGGADVTVSGGVINMTGNGAVVSSGTALVQASAGNVALGSVTGNAVTVNATAGSISDANGANVNVVSATSVNLSTLGSIGSTGDPLETIAPGNAFLINQSAASAQVGIFNAGDITLDGSSFVLGSGTATLFQASGNVEVSGGGYSFLGPTNIVAGNNLLLNGQLTGLAAGNDLSIVAGNEFVPNSNEVRADSSAISITAGSILDLSGVEVGFTFPAGTSSTNVTLTAPIILLDSSVAGAESRVGAVNLLTVSANELRLRGGPTGGDVAELAGDGGVDITLFGTNPVLEITAGPQSGSHALVFSDTGPINIVAGSSTDPGSVELTGNSVFQTDALIISQSGAVNVQTNTCNGCTPNAGTAVSALLLNATSDVGFFGTPVSVTGFPLPSTEVPATTPQEPAINEVLALTELEDDFEKFAEGDSDFFNGDDDDDKDGDKKTLICR